MAARTIERQTLAMIMKSFGESIQLCRKRAGLTQEKLALQSGLAYRFLQDIEAGNKQPSITTVFKLAEALQTTPGELLDNVFEQWQRSPKSDAAQ